MQHIVDPIADWIFDAAVVDISEKGVVETKPLTDEDWLQVERGALIPPSPPPAEDATGNGSRRGCVVEGRPWRPELMLKGCSTWATRSTKRARAVTSSTGIRAIRRSCSKTNEKQ
jgi:hypothetical protein